MLETWVRQRDAVIDDVYCPIDVKNNKIILGLTYIGKPKGKIIGEFWFEGDTIKVELKMKRRNQQGEEN